MLIALLIGLAVESWQSAASPTSANGQLPTVNFSFSMRGDRARGWPVKTKVSLVSAKFTKEWTIEAADVRRPVTLQLPPAIYELTIVAAHHRVFRRARE